MAGGGWLGVLWARSDTYWVPGVSPLLMVLDVREMVPLKGKWARKPGSPNVRFHVDSWEGNHVFPFGFSRESDSLGNLLCREMESLG